MMKQFLILFSLSVIGHVSAQESLIDTVFIDNQFQNGSKTAKITNLNSDKILENPTSLSDLLRSQTNIYIKENGRGAVSSASFRGTTAQQTAFVWNGINVNSIFLGQGDINNLNPLSYESIGIKSGGGSVVYGSGAIGGSIHLNNRLDFDKGFSGRFFSEYASFGTSNSVISATFSNPNFSFNFNINHSQSQNNYDVPEKKFKNINGNYENSSINLGIAYKLNQNNQFYWQSQHYDSNQRYPVFEESFTKTKYNVQTFRTLAGWKNTSKNIINDFKLAYLEDNFQYFSDINQPKTSGGIGKQYIVKNDFDVLISGKSSINFISEYQYHQAEGFGSGIQTPKRNLGSFALLYRNNYFEKFYWELGMKKEIVEDYKSPFLFSASAKYSVKNWYKVRLNLSKNFRTPTFNELYWQPGGNLDLKPETSYQTDVSNDFIYRNFKLGLTPYYIHSVDNIVWTPISTSIWTPKNIKSVDSYGLETNLTFDKKIGNHTFSSALAYTFSKSVNTETHKQLMYVPLHKININADYHYKIIGFFAQAFYNGKTFTNDDETHFMRGYLLVNSGITVTLFKNYTFGFRVNNITNQIYQTTEYYYFPKRNYAVNFKIKF